MTSLIGRKKISWARAMPNLSPNLSHRSRVAKAKQALETKSLKEVLLTKPVIKKALKKIIKTTADKATAITQRPPFIPKQDPTKFVYGHQKPSIRATMAMSQDGRCGLTAGKLGIKAGREILKDYRPGQYLEQIIKSTKAKAKEAEKIKQTHRNLVKKKESVDEESVMRKIQGDSKKK